MDSIASAVAMVSTQFDARNLRGGGGASCIVYIHSVLEVVIL